LPFVNASNDPNADYLSDGLTEGLINSLSQIPNLAVMSRSSVFHYKGRDVDQQTVARDLKIEGVVTGRIVQHGDQLIISAELIDARNNHNLWGEQYDRKVADALAIQQDITRSITARLRERLSGETTKQVAKGGTADPEAYQLYLKGRFYWDKRTPDSLEKARDFFNQAIEKDPNHALAYSMAVTVILNGTPAVAVPWAVTTRCVAGPNTFCCVTPELPPQPLNTIDAKNISASENFAFVFCSVQLRNDRLETGLRNAIADSRRSQTMACLLPGGKTANTFFK
jgi:TolB-like protein